MCISPANLHNCLPVFLIKTYPIEAILEFQKARAHARVHTHTHHTSHSLLWDKDKYLSRFDCVCWLSTFPASSDHSVPPTFSPLYTLCSLQTHSLVHIDPLSGTLTLPVCAWLTPICLSDCSISGPSSETFPESQTNSNFPFIQSYDTWYLLSHIYLGCDITHACLPRWELPPLHYVPSS